jgi:hypothetical protein
MREIVDLGIHVEDHARAPQGRPIEWVREQTGPPSTGCPLTRSGRWRRSDVYGVIVDVVPQVAVALEEIGISRAHLSPVTVPAEILAVIDLTFIRPVELIAGWDLCSRKDRRSPRSSPEIGRGNLACGAAWRVATLTSP